MTKPSENERTTQIKRLRFVENWTLQMIADKYGVSRERVRQILGNTGTGFINEFHRKLVTQYSLTNNRVSEITGLHTSTIMKYRKGMRHDIEGGTVKAGMDIEDYVSESLTKMGITNELKSHHHPFDIELLDGTRIDVKSSAPLKNFPKNTYNFHPPGKEKGEYADFYVCVTSDTKDIFVIPFHEIKKGTPIRFCFPPKKKGSKWHKFHNRFDLLSPSLTNETKNNRQKQAAVAA